MYQGQPNFRRTISRVGSVVVALFFVFSLGVAFFLSQQKQDVRQQASTSASCGWCAGADQCYGSTGQRGTPVSTNLCSTGNCCTGYSSGESSGGGAPGGGGGQAEDECTNTDGSCKGLCHRFCGGCLANKCISKALTNQKTCNTLIDEQCQQSGCGGDGVFLASGQQCCAGLQKCGNGRCGTSCVADCYNAGSVISNDKKCCEGLSEEPLSGTTTKKCVGAGQAKPSCASPNSCKAASDCYSSGGALESSQTCADGLFCCKPVTKEAVACVQSSNRPLNCECSDKSQCASTNCESYGTGGLKYCQRGQQPCGSSCTTNDGCATGLFCLGAEGKKVCTCQGKTCQQGVCVEIKTEVKTCSGGGICTAASLCVSQNKVVISDPASCGTEICCQERVSSDPAKKDLCNNTSETICRDMTPNVSFCTKAGRNGVCIGSPGGSCVCQINESKCSGGEVISQKSCTPDGRRKTCLNPDLVGDAQYQFEKVSTTECPVQSDQTPSATVSPSPSSQPIAMLQGKAWCSSDATVFPGDTVAGGNCRTTCNPGDGLGTGREKKIDAFCTTGICCVPNEPFQGPRRGLATTCTELCSNANGCDCPNTCVAKTTEPNKTCGGLIIQPTQASPPEEPAKDFGTQLIDGAANIIGNGLVGLWTIGYGKEKTTEYLKAVTKTDGYSLAPTTITIAGKSVDVPVDLFGNYVSECRGGTNGECLVASAGLAAPGLATGAVAGVALPAAVTAVGQAYIFVGQAAVSYSTSYLIIPATGIAAGGVATVASTPVVQNLLGFFDRISHTPIGVAVAPKLKDAGQVVLSAANAYSVATNSLRTGHTVADVFRVNETIGAIAEQVLDTSSVATFSDARVINVGDVASKAENVGDVAGAFYDVTGEKVEGVNFGQIGLGNLWWGLIPSALPAQATSD